jgi:UDP-N-acetylmuramoyl-tripeptide--D-alanyl-D-alanine ligase
MNFFDLSNPHLYISIVISILNAILLCFVGYKFLQIIQLSDYKLSGYFAWVKDTKAKYISRISMLSLLSLAGVLVTNACFDGYTSNMYLSYMGLIFYLYFCITFVVNLYTAPKKTPLKYTRRMNRLVAVLFILSLLVTFGLIAFSSIYLLRLRFGLVVITPILLIILVPIAHIITLPIEKIIAIHYIRKAKAKLFKMPRLIKIGITGSFGKTSCKYILNKMLSKKYKVCMSPHSFNTPMGISKVITKYLKVDDEVLIAEMGAKYVGDIKYLCSIVNPRYAILTAVGNQHLQTFKTYDNILRTKNELILSLPPDGYAVFNGDNDGSKKLFELAKVDKNFVSVDDDKSFCYAKNVKVDHLGSECDIYIDGKLIKCKTKLLGKHNILNILMCSALAYKLGVDLKDIESAIQDLRSTPHRLDVMKNENGVTIIDDSYNASVESSSCALDTLSMFEGRKIIMTPGLVELGEDEKKANTNFGEHIAKVANICIIVNKVNASFINDGLTKGGMSQENIILADDLVDAKKKLKDLLKPNDVLLIENDLPDNYT